MNKSTMQKAARDLIASPAHRGDHGFTGKQRTAWRTQRRKLLAGLERIVSGRKIMSTRQFESRCPRFVVDDHLWDANGESRPNPRWSKGTIAGARWVTSAQLRISNWRYWGDGT